MKNKYNRALGFFTGAGIIIAFALVISMAYLMPSIVEEMLLFLIITILALILAFVSLLSIYI